MELPFNDFNTFLTWFCEVILPYLSTFVATGGLATLIYKIAKLVHNTNISKNVLVDTRNSLSNCRDDLATLQELLRQIKEVSNEILDSIPNDELREQLREKLNSINVDVKLNTTKEEEEKVVQVSIKKSKKDKKKKQAV